MNKPIRYIYALKDPDTLEVRYIGQASHVRYRANRHIHDALRKKERGHSLTLKEKWLVDLNDRCLRPIDEVICSATVKSEIDDLEIYWINHYRKISHLGLFNIMPGGGLVIRGETPECVRKKISISKTGRKASPAEMAHILKITSMRRGKKMGPMHPNTRAAITGRKKTPEELKKISLANKGKIVTPEARARMSAAQKAISPEVRKTMGNKKGWKPSSEHIAKLSSLNRGRKLTPEHIERIRQTHTGKFVSIETRKRIAAGRWGNLNYIPRIEA